VRTAQEVGLLAASDEEYLALAMREGRVIFTRDVDFLRLQAEGFTHTGIVYAHQQTPIGAMAGALCWSTRGWSRAICAITWSSCESLRDRAALRQVVMGRSGGAAERGCRGEGGQGSMAGRFGGVQGVGLRVRPFAGAQGIGCRLARWHVRELAHWRVETGLGLAGASLAHGLGLASASFARSEVDTLALIVLILKRVGSRRLRGLHWSPMSRRMAGLAPRLFTGPSAPA